MGYQVESFSLGGVGDVMPPDALNRNEIETVKLGVWGILQKLLFGNECVLNEFNNIPPQESAFPVEPPYALIEKVRKYSNRGFFFPHLIFIFLMSIGN